MLDRTTCSWCHATNSTHEMYCRGCRHEAHRPRSECRCERCLKVLGSYRDYSTQWYSRIGKPW